jgi:hypothetical protein
MKRNVIRGDDSVRPDLAEDLRVPFGDDPPRRSVRSVQAVLPVIVDALSWPSCPRGCISLASSRQLIVKLVVKVPPELST